MSDSVRPDRWQPTRLPRPWDSPGKDTGVGCHFFLQCRKVKSESGVAQSCPTPRHPMDSSPPGSSVPGILQARALEWAPSPSPSSRWCSGKGSKCQCRRCKRHGFSPWVRKTLLEQEMATHSSTLAWKILWTEEPGGLQSMGVGKSRTRLSDHEHSYSLVSI